MAAIGSGVLVCGVAAATCATGCVAPCQSSGSTIDSDLIAASIDHFVVSADDAIVVYEYLAGPEMDGPAALNPEALGVRPATIESWRARNGVPAELDPFAVQGQTSVELHFVTNAELNTAFEPDPQWDAFLDRHAGARAAFRFSRAGVDCDQALVWVDETTGPGGFTGYFGVFSLEGGSWLGAFYRMYVT